MLALQEAEVKVRAGAYLDVCVNAIELAPVLTAADFKQSLFCIRFKYHWVSLI